MRTFVSSLKISAVGLCALVSFTAGSAHADNSVFEQSQPTSLDVASSIPAANSVKQKADVYIVQFKAAPALSFSGAGALASTEPEAGQKINVQSSAVQSYRSFLSQSQDQALQNCGVDKSNKIYEYTIAFNGMAVKMTGAEAALMRSEPNVMRVTRDQAQKMDTDSTRKFLKLNKGRLSAWRNSYTGEDVIVGVLDSGIDPENPSFADVPTPRRGDRGRKIPYGPPPAGWNGDECDFGNTEFNPLDVPFTCNNKILGARTYSAGYLRGNPASEMLAAGSTLSARDDNGHGSAAASNAAGNYGVQAVINDEEVGEDVMSGVAPRARIAAYKVCWDGPAVDDPATPANEEDDGCFNSDSMAAIDQAVADGVDVINFSIGGSSTSFGGLDAIAFLFAANAGVHVATSAGNSGPDLQTVGAPAVVPWITSVGAINDDQNFALGLAIDAPSSIAGSVTAVEGSGPIQLETSGPIAGNLVPTEPANGCEALTNSDAIAGNIALVIRGACAFDDKYANAEAAGATAIVVYNDGTASDRQNPFLMSGVSDDRTIGGVMIGFEDGDALANASGVAVTLDDANQISLANRVVDFSSRGPNGGALDIIKPDVVAPGVNILSAETTTENADEIRGSQGVNSQQFISGTSFSSPHVAGVLALIKQAHPEWTPAQARSALMTTARQNLTTQFSTDAATPFEIGAGHVVPNKAFNPGLVYDAGLSDYVAFSCGNNVRVVDEAVCDFLALEGRSFDGSELNLPSIGIGQLVGTQTVTRTVTNVDEEDPYRRRQKTTRYKAVVDAPDGVDVKVSPRNLRLRSGESADYTVTFTTADNVALDDFAFGSVTWVEKGKKRPRYYRYLYYIGYYIYSDYYYGYGNGYDDGYRYANDYNYYGHAYSFAYGRGYRNHRSNNVAREVRSPIAVRPVALATEGEVDNQAEIISGVDGETAVGSITVPVAFGYEGAYTAAFAGMAQSFSFDDTITVDTPNRLNALCFDLPAGANLRMALFDEDTSTPGEDDLDMRLFTVSDCATFGNAALIASSGGPSSNETIDIANPAAGSYAFIVDYFASGSPDNSVDYRLWLNIIGGDEGNTAVSTPSAATLGESTNITLDYQGLNANSRYMGVISHQNGEGEIDRTILDVNTQ